MYQQKISGALHALEASELDHKAIITQAETAIQSFVTDLKSGTFPAFTVTESVDDLLPLSELALSWSKAYTHMVFLGVGGSSLGAQMLVNFMGRFRTRAPEVILLDNVDPSSINNLINGLPLASTGVVSVSKSGGTIETLAQTALFVDAFKQKSLPINEHFFGITEEKSSKLRTYLENYKVPILNHPNDVGGRFTLFTLVSLLPALLAGMNVVNLRMGGRKILEAFLEDPLNHPSTRGAALAVLAESKGVNMQVLMPYTDRLKTFSNWYVQLWAESIGKEGKGTTPIPAVGSTDQHSFLQLMMEGPHDKLVTIMYTPAEENERKISPEEASLLGDDILNGLSLGTLLYNQAHGTADALAASDRAVRLFQIDTLNEETLGGLAMHFMLETAVAGAIMNVNTWNQPGVEDGKKRTMSYLEGHQNN